MTPPTRFCSTLRTRWHELDGSRVARPRVLMDWMEHARSEVPPDDPLHDVLNYGLARAVRIDCVSPVTQPMNVAIAVWVSHVGRTSYAIDHELTGADDGAVLARARLSFVRVGQDRRPTAVPAVLAERAFGAPLALTLGRGLSASEGTPVFTRTLQMAHSHENRGRHVSHTQIVDLLDDARRLARLAGALPDAPGSPWSPPSAVAVDYEGEAHAGDWLVASVWKAPPGTKGTVLALARRDDGEPIARAHFVDEG